MMVIFASWHRSAGGLFCWRALGLEGLLGWRALSVGALSVGGLFLLEGTSAEGSSLEGSPAGGLSCCMTPGVNCVW